MSKQNPVTEEEAELFRHAVGPVTPLRQDKVLLRPSPPPPLALQRMEDEARVIEDMLSELYHPDERETGEELWFSRPGLQHALLRRLRMGRLAIQDELDLHGLTVPLAREALVNFLFESRRRRYRCVRIVHGKGRRSARQPVLKQKVNGWLRAR
ncbi:MAG: DNA mismatch repair protein MutS, partial [Gammaproteobacteria bacterium]